YGLGEKGWVRLLELVFSFPCEFGTSFRVPSNLDDRNTTSLQLLDFTIYDLHWFFNKVELIINIKLI
ncbi:hypothetical protein Tco_0473876, partial [Tanacetum coccineum]